MSGHWTELWDEERQKWVEVWIDLPAPLTKGTATTISGERPQLLDPNGRPFVRPPRIGFRK